MASASITESRAAGIMVFRFLNKTAEYLILQASNLNHHWTPPKGHVDPGETDLVAAQREVREEAGLRPEDYDILDGFNTVLNYNAWNKRKTVVYWTARVKNPSIPIIISSEHQDFRWGALRTVLEMLEHENQKTAYVNLESFLTQKFPVDDR